ncbi:hypothetical protein HAX54_022712, partial [Datura stramonium]|nr:hypothetical protein [Datura stramonium]
GDFGVADMMADSMDREGCDGPSLPPSFSLLRTPFLDKVDSIRDEPSGVGLTEGSTAHQPSDGLSKWHRDSSDVNDIHQIDDGPSWAALRLDGEDEDPLGVMDDSMDCQGCGVPSLPQSFRLVRKLFLDKVDGKGDGPSEV